MSGDLPDVWSPPDAEDELHRISLQEDTMTLIEIKHDGSQDTAAPAPHESAIRELREALRGEVLTPGDGGYAEAARVWNGAHVGSPAVIVRCRGAADVIEAVSFARIHGLQMAVRGGGHSVAGFSTNVGGIVIDLSAMNDVRVDTTARWATVGGGAVWADVDHETQAHGLATTGGLVSTTGVAGFTLGGGIGWLMRKHGLACDNLISADVVTADGRLVHASPSENSDLFWGLRGGGGNFGIVTQFEFELHPVGPTVYAGPIFYSAEADTELLRRFRAWAPNASDDVTALVDLTTAPPLPVIPEEWHGKQVAAFIATSAGPIEEAESHVHGFREVAEPVADLLGPMPYTAMQTLIDPLWPQGIHAYFKATNLARLDDQLIERLSKLHRQAPGPQCEIHVHQMGGAIARVGEGESAFAERSMPYVLNAVTGWQDPAVAEAHVAWARAVIDAASDVSTGRAYVNFLADSDATGSAYGSQTYERLVELKSKYDPTNAFALNHNIPPRKES
jgi:FAD binding domain/Berberine and berberine like